MFRGVHGSVWVGFMPNLRPTRWYQVSNKKTCHRPQKPMGQVRLDPIGQWSSRLKLKYAAWGSNQRQLHVLLVGSLPDLSKSTRFEQNNTIYFSGFEKNSPDLSKKITRFSLDLRKTHQICAVFEWNPINRSWICAKMRRSEWKLVCFCQIGGRSGL